MDISNKTNRLRAVLGAILVAAAILGISGLSSAQPINPVQQQIPLGGPPFAAITSPDGRYVFVSTGNPANAIAVIRQNKTFAEVVQNIPTCGGADGLAMSKDGRYLIAVVQPPGLCPSGGVQFIDVQKAIAGDSTAAMPTIPTDPTAIEVAISPDNKLVFVANEHSGGSPCANPDTVSVIDFNSALSLGQSPLIGTIPVDCGVVGLATLMASLIRALPPTQDLLAGCGAQVKTSTSPTRQRCQAETIRTIATSGMRTSGRRRDFDGGCAAQPAQEVQSF